MREGQFGEISTPLQADLNVIVEHVLATTDSDFATLCFGYNTVLNSMGLMPMTWCGKIPQDPAPQDFFSDVLMAQNAPIIVDNVRFDERFSTALAGQKAPVLGLLGVPISVTDVGTVGVISALSCAQRGWTNKDRQVLKTAAKSVENILLKEMFRVESLDANKLLSEYDQIISAFSMVRAAPTSIHNQNGRLVFANGILTELVSESELEGRAYLAALLANPEHLIFLYRTRNGEVYEIQRRQTYAQYHVCQWRAEQGTAN